MVYVWVCVCVCVGGGGGGGGINFRQHIVCMVMTRSCTFYHTGDVHRFVSVDVEAISLLTPDEGHLPGGRAKSIAR